MKGSEQSAVQVHTERKRTFERAPRAKSGEIHHCTLSARWLSESELIWVASRPFAGSSGCLPGGVLFWIGYQSGICAVYQLALTSNYSLYICETSYVRLWQLLCSHIASKYLARQTAQCDLRATPPFDLSWLRTRQSHLIHSLNFEACIAKTPPWFAMLIFHNSSQSAWLASNSHRHDKPRFLWAFDLRA